MAGLPTARALRTETPVATTATPSSRTIRPTSCDPSCAPVREIGLVAAAATASWPDWAARPGLGAWLGAEDGLICGNRLAALPAGTLTVPPEAPEPMVGSAPIGNAAPASAGRSAPKSPAVPSPLAVPSWLGVVATGPPDVGPPEVEPPEVESPDIGPAEEAAPDFGLELGLGDAGALATVTVGALPAAVSGDPLPLATETVAENRMVSPAGAAFGTVTRASICGAAGRPAGRVSR